VSDKESNAIKVKPILTSNNLIMKAADAALNAVQDTMGSLREDDHYLYMKMAKAALDSARAALGND